jgi:hypothetical protein
MRSYRTTILGVLTIAGVLISAAISLLNGHSPDFGTTSAGVLMGVGLIHAADNKNLPPAPPAAPAA